MNSKLKDCLASKAVRNGRCGTSPDVLSNYLYGCEKAAELLPRDSARQLQIDVIEVLLETICDDLVAKCWRTWCFDNTYRPLAARYKLNKTNIDHQELIRLQCEIRTASFYFLS